MTGFRATQLLSAAALLVSVLSGGQSFPDLARQADAAREADRLTEAAALYRRALTLNPSWAEGWFSLGTIQYDESAYGEASDSLANAVKLAPDNGPALLLLGLSEYELGRDAAALQHLEVGAAAKIPAGVALRNVALYHQAELLRRAGRFEAAEAVLYPLCAHSITSTELLRSLGAIALRIREKTIPESVPAAQVGDAEWLAAQKKFEDARTAYLSLLANFPGFANLHLAYGRFLLKAHEVPGAEAQFEEEIRHHPGSVLARLEIAAIKYRVDSSAGLPYAQQAVKLDPASPFARYLLGLILLDMGDCKSAIPELEIAEKSLKKEAGVYFALGNAYSRCGRRQDAARARASFQNLNRNSRNMPQVNVE